MDHVIKVIYCQEELEEAVELLRIVTGSSKEPNIPSATAQENLKELDLLLPIAEERIGSRHLIDIESRCHAALGTSTTWVLLEATSRLKERVKTILAGAFEH